MESIELPGEQLFFGEETLLEGILINYLLRYILRSQIIPFAHLNAV